MKHYLKCNQKSMNCSSNSILWGQLFQKYENLKWDIVTWKYGWTMVFPFPTTPKLLTVSLYNFQYFFLILPFKILTCNIMLLKGATLILASPCANWFTAGKLFRWMQIPYAYVSAKQSNEGRMSRMCCELRLILITYRWLRVRLWHLPLQTFRSYQSCAIYV